VALEDNAGPSFACDVTEETGLDECAIPLVTLSASSGPEGDAPTEKKGRDKCSEDCELFYPTDLLSFAWQIARGMVSETCTETHLASFVRAPLTSFKKVRIWIKWRQASSS
jgi:hypothetical protein